MSKHNTVQSCCHNGNPFNSHFFVLQLSYLPFTHVFCPMTGPTTCLLNCYHKSQASKSSTRFDVLVFCVPMSITYQENSTTLRRQGDRCERVRSPDNLISSVAPCAVRLFPVLFGRNVPHLSVRNFVLLSSLCHDAQSEALLTTIPDEPAISRCPLWLVWAGEPISPRSGPTCRRLTSRSVMMDCLRLIETQPAVREGYS